VRNGARFVAIIALVSGLSACGGKKTATLPAAPPAVVAAPPQQIQTPPPAPAPPPPDAIQLLIASAEQHFETGQQELKAGHLGKARGEFDRAVGVLLEHPGGAKSEPRLRAEYDQLLNRIAALEAAALRQGDGFSENRSEPAAIDQLLAVATFPRATPTTETAVAEELEVATYDLPVISNDKVLSYVELFQGNLHSFLSEGLTRGSQYLPRIREVFQREGIPLDLAYVPLIESAFKSTALSRAKAKGMWQFQLPTARDYGLQYNWFIDERSDFEKSTEAAAKHFKMLAKMFNGDWNLALASYNVGQGKVLAALKRAKTSDYWKLTETTKFLPRDTRAYVPMIWAAIIIAKSPEQFGFDVETREPLTYDVVTVPDAVGLLTVAEWSESTVDVLKELNPELRRNTTPMGEHQLRVPAGTKDAVEAKLATADPSTFATFMRHTVRSGETLASIANKFKVKRADLAEANGLKTTSKLRSGQSLLVPGASAAAAVTSSRSTAAAPVPAGSSSSAAKTRPAVAKATTSSKPTTYKVKSGDTLSAIARRFDVTVDQIKRWNKLSTTALSIGHKLTIYRN
jgi:membrane-bound lytic murein transglycosylase D